MNKRDLINWDIYYLVFDYCELVLSLAIFRKKDF